MVLAVEVTITSKDRIYCNRMKWVVRENSTLAAELQYLCKVLAVPENPQVSVYVNDGTKAYKLQDVDWSI